MGRHPCRSSTAGRSRTSSSPASPWSPRAAWARTASFTRRRCWPSARRASPRPRIPSDASIPAPQVLASSRPRRAGARPPRQIFDLVGTRAGAEACVGSCARSVTHLRDALPRVLVASLAPPVDAAKYAADLGAVILGYLGAGALLAGLVMAGFSAVLSFWAGLQENAVMVQVGRRAFFAAAAMVAVAGGLLEWALLSHDFSLAYVAEHTDLSTPTALLVAGFYGGQEGSLLYWALVLGVLGSVSLVASASLGLKMAGYA